MVLLKFNHLDLLKASRCQVDTFLNTVGNMCFFLEGGGECGQHGIVVAQAIIRIGCGSETLVHLNCCLWKRRRKNILNPTAKSIGFQVLQK